METTGHELPDAFAALGHPVRLAMVERLLAEGELPAGAFRGVGDVSAPALSRHLRVLREAGLLIQRTDAQRRLYSIRPEALAAVGRWSLTFRQFWDGSLDRLDAALSEERH